MNKEEYRDVIIKTKLADYGPVHGNIVIMPYGMGIWNLMKDIHHTLFLNG